MCTVLLFIIAVIDLLKKYIFYFIPAVNHVKNGSQSSNNIIIVHFNFQEKNKILCDKLFRYLTNKTCLHQQQQHRRLLTMYIFFICVNNIQ